MTGKSEMLYVNGVMRSTPLSMNYECDECGCTLYPESYYIDRQMFYVNHRRLCAKCALEELDVERVYE